MQYGNALHFCQYQLSPPPTPHRRPAESYGPFRAKQSGALMNPYCPHQIATMKPITVLIFPPCFVIDIRLQCCRRLVVEAIHCKCLLWETPLKKLT